MLGKSGCLAAKMARVVDTKNRLWVAGHHGASWQVRGLSGHGRFRRRRHNENRFMLNFRVIPVQFSGQSLGLWLCEALCAGADCTGDHRDPTNGVLVRTTSIWDESISRNDSGRFCVLRIHRYFLARAVPCTTGGSGFKPRWLRRRVRNRPVSKDLHRTSGRAWAKELGTGAGGSRWIRRSLCLRNARTISLDCASCIVFALLIAS